ncbi:MAG: DUF1223 domain-containing protein [Pseudomonadota bacterium]
MGTNPVAAAILLGLTSLAAPSATADSADVVSAPVLVELFTSQSCSSCPPAEELFSQLAERSDLVVIEWHVDYWDDLVHGRAGSWKDPFSNAEHTERQRRYNMNIRGMRSVYTPQAIVNGNTETTGSRARAISELVSAATRPIVDLSAAPTSLSIGRAEHQDGINADVIMVKLLPEQETEVPRGENRGRTLASRNIAVNLQVLGQWRGEAMSYDIPSIPSGYDCALLVQDTETMQVLGARYCAAG